MASSMTGRRSPGRDPAGFGGQTPFATLAARCGWRNKDGARHLSWRTAILSPSPVLGRSTLGAVDMPIGCALTFFVLKQGQSVQQFDMLVRCSGARKPASIGEITSTAPLDYRTASTRASLGARSACARAVALFGRKTALG